MTECAEVQSFKVRSIEYRRPDQIKKYDGINGLYGIVNAIKQVQHLGEKKYLDELWTKLCEQAHPWPNILWDGIPDDQMEMLIYYAIDQHNKRNVVFQRNYDTIDVKKIKGLKQEPSGNKSLEMLRPYVHYPYVALLVKITMPWPLWATITFIRKSIGKRWPMLTGCDPYRVLHKDEPCNNFTCNWKEVDETKIMPKKLIDVNHVYQLTNIPA